jgi:hypothetical protein
MGSSAEPKPERFDARLRASLRAVAGCGAAITLVALAFAGLRAGLSAATGAALALGNLWVLARIIAALLPDDRQGAEVQNRGGWALAAALKMAALLAVAWLLMRRGVVSPLPMLFGFLSLPMGIAIGSLVSDRSEVSQGQ